MNKGRRKALADVEEKLSELSGVVEELRDEEQDYFDVMPEGIQMSEKGEMAEAAISAMDEAIDQITEALTQVSGAAA